MLEQVFSVVSGNDDNNKSGGITVLCVQINAYHMRNLILFNTVAK